MKEGEKKKAGAACRPVPAACPDEPFQTLLRPIRINFRLSKQVKNAKKIALGLRPRANVAQRMIFLGAREKKLSVFGSPAPPQGPFFDIFFGAAEGRAKFFGVCPPQAKKRMGNLAHLGSDRRSTNVRDEFVKKNMF